MRRRALSCGGRRAASGHKVSAPGFTDGPMHELMNSAYGKLIEFNGWLYVGVSSGYEGAFLYRSIGNEIWRFDGTHVGARHFKQR